MRIRGGPCQAFILVFHWKEGRRRTFRLRTHAAGLSKLRRHTGGNRDCQSGHPLQLRVMGHFVGDCSQPSHATKHHSGWVGANPKGYATNSSIHGWIDGGFFRKSGGIQVDSLTGKLRPAKIVGDPLKQDDLLMKGSLGFDNSDQNTTSEPTVRGTPVHEGGKGSKCVSRLPQGAPELIRSAGRHRVGHIQSRTGQRVGGD
jgi:hypothetical protein